MSRSGSAPGPRRTASHAPAGPAAADRARRPCRRPSPSRRARPAGRHRTRRGRRRPARPRSGRGRNRRCAARRRDRPAAARPSSRPSISRRYSEQPRWPLVSPIRISALPSRFRARSTASGRVGDQPDAADHRGRQDRLAARLVVERHVARDDRVVERQAGLAHALDAAGELAHDLGLLGVAEIHVVGQRQRQRADRGQVAPALGHRLHAAAHRIGAAIARRAVGRQRQRLAAVGDPDHRRVAARPLDRVALHEMVVLLPDPALRGEVGAGDQPLQAVDRVAVGQARAGSISGSGSAARQGRS